EQDSPQHAPPVSDIPPRRTLGQAHDPKPDPAGLHPRGLTAGTKYEQCSYFVPERVVRREVQMFRSIVEEAAALASLALFVGMIAIWAQVIASLRRHGGDRPGEKPHDSGRGRGRGGQGWPR